MIAVITGDIVNSQASNPNEWLGKLKQVLDKYGAEPAHWEVYRGDSFQLKTEVDKALIAALHIKASVKTSALHDVRIGIGIGEENHTSNKITEANGTAYVHSGQVFEGLKKQNMSIKSGNDSLDESINTMLALAMLTANNWSATASEVILTMLDHPKHAQKEIAAMLNKSQSSVSESLKRAGLDEIMRMNKYYQTQFQ